MCKTFYHNFWTMEKWHVQTFIKVYAVVFEKCKVKTSSSLRSVCMLFSFTIITHLLLFNLDCLIQKRFSKKNQNVRGLFKYECSSFITLTTYMLRQNAIPFWKELFVAFKMASNIKKHSLHFSSYRPLYKCHSCILKLF